jgi:hypothetical protein
MIKKLLMATIMSIACNLHAETVDSIHKGKSITISSLNCADTIMNVIPMLGRGPDFPQFLVADVETELDRQQKGSQLLSLECLAEPKIKASSVPLMDDPTKSILIRLSVSFPLKLVVGNKSDKKMAMELSVNQNYFVENINTPEKTKVTQNFIVKKN